MISLIKLTTFYRMHTIILLGKTRIDMSVSVKNMQNTGRGTCSSILEGHTRDKFFISILRKNEKERCKLSISMKV